jgi:hypothetical protein
MKKALIPIAIVCLLLIVFTSCKKKENAFPVTKNAYVDSAILNNLKGKWIFKYCAIDSNLNKIIDSNEINHFSSYGDTIEFRSDGHFWWSTPYSHGDDALWNLIDNSYLDDGIKYLNFYPPGYVGIDKLSSSILILREDFYYFPLNGFDIASTRWDIYTK